jgi:hypothetical protein
MPSSAVRTFSDPEEQAAWSVQTQDYESPGRLTPACCVIRGAFRFERRTSITYPVWTDRSHDFKFCL